MIKEITPQELKRMQEAKEHFLLIDVREPYEAERCSIGGKLIPMGEIVDRIAEIPKDIPVVMHCRSGSRSSAVISALHDRYGFSNLLNLRGGILAFGAEVDDAMTCD